MWAWDFLRSTPASTRPEVHDSVNDLSIWIAIVALATGCFFAACNVSLKIYSLSKLTEIMEAAGRADRVDSFIARVPRMQLVTGTIRATLNLAVLLAVLAYVRNHASWDTWFEYLVAFVVAGMLVSAFMVAIPLSLARYHSERLLARAMSILHVVDRICLPLSTALHVFDPIVRRLSGGKKPTDVDDEASERIMTVVEDHEAQGAVDTGQKQMIEAVFDLADMTVGEIMTPRTDVTGIDVGASLDQVKKTILHEGHSRIPGYEADLDHIVGILYAKDLLRFLGDGEAGEGFELRTILREALMVPESKWVRQLLAEFRARKVHIAIVLDEYGGTAGLVTIEDILEELVGEIHDEYEPSTEEAEIRRIDDRTFEVDARVHVDDVNDDLNIRLPEDEDYETVGGFVFSTLGHIPGAGEAFEFGNARFTVMDAGRTRVNRVRIEVAETSVAAEEGGEKE